ncbi:GNAT family N-acetyltransferase [Flavobacterium sp. J27]|uniref:GNAT family N-acetyltransferase n=1 Tax=Flavobacterium sp. J27 TaxID=2060419 RepID=UPI001030B64F|nr:GNAT family N-acetyltransferase [Flavobacterium sp. J27]
MKESIVAKIVKDTLSDEVSILLHQLNPDLEWTTIKERQEQMFQFPNYICFGLYLDNKLIGITCAWVMVRIYCGKQIEIDNVILDKSYHSKGYGAVLVEFIEKWAIENQCNTIELNTYVQNSRSHKFYFNQGYSILGYHFQKRILK